MAEVNALYTVYKLVEQANRYFVLQMDKPAMALIKQTLPKARAIGYSITLDEELRLALLEKL